MFFRREAAVVLTFDGRLESARRAGFSVARPGAGRGVAMRDGLAAVIEDVSGGQPHFGRVGIVLGKEIAELVDVGYQKLFVAPSGASVPALATHLTGLHAFEEDLREALGLSSLYNESLGTVNEKHLYDRLKDRDRGVGPRPWER
jgi:hypothetical protein